MAEVGLPRPSLMIAACPKQAGRMPRLLQRLVTTPPRSSRIRGNPKHVSTPFLLPHMTRNFDLVRQILFQIERAQSGEPVQQLSVEGDVVETELGEHLEIMIESGLLDGEVVSLTPLIFHIRRLTWAGHDFLNNARNDTVWKRVLDEANAKGMSVTMTVLNGLLTKAAQKYAGLE